jgi:hypothetical protein
MNDLYNLIDAALVKIKHNSLLIIIVKNYFYLKMVS